MLTMEIISFHTPSSLALVTKLVVKDVWFHLQMKVIYAVSLRNSLRKKSEVNLILLIWAIAHLHSFVDLSVLQLDKAGRDGSNVALLV